MGHPRLFLLGFVVALVASTPVSAQYMYIDIDGDGINTSSDILSVDAPTTLTLFLNTNHDRDGSLQTCNSHSNALCDAPSSNTTLDLFGYTVVLSASGGTVSWGTFTPDSSAFVALQPQVQDSHDVELAFSRSAGTFSPAGLISLGKISVTITSGSPSIQIARSTALDPFGFGTGFATECEAFAYMNSYVLGDSDDPCGSTSGLPGDWFDTDGVSTGGMSATGLYPNAVLRGTENRIVISGSEFQTGMTVEFSGTDGSVPADSVNILSPNSLEAFVRIPETWQGQLDVTIHAPSGSVAVLPSSVTVENAVAALVDESNHVVVGVNPALPAFSPEVRSNPGLSALSPENAALLCPQPPVGCTVQDTIGVLAPTGHCSGPPAFTATGRYIYFWQVGDSIVGKNCPAVLKMTVIDNSGGHCHTDPGHPLGSPTYVMGNTGTDGLQFRVTHTWPEVGGILAAYSWSTSPSCPDYNDSTTIKFTYCLANQSFFGPHHAIYTQGAGDSLVGDLPEHPDNHIGIPAMLTALSSLSSSWATRYPSGPKLLYNDMTIFGGGVFDYKDLDWKPPHCGHRAGMEMDFGIKNLNNTQRRVADQLLKALSFKVLPESTTVKGVKVPHHWHLKYAGTGTYKGPGSTLR